MYNNATLVLGTNLYNARLTKGFTQKELSSLTGIPQPTISQLEKGKLNPSVKTISKLADALDKKLVVSFED